jgi:hypothetical protein
MANFGAGQSPFEYGKGIYDPYKNLVRPRGALTQLLTTGRAGETLFSGTGGGQAQLKSLLTAGGTTKGTTANTFEKAIQGVQDPTSLYNLAASLVVGRRKYQDQQGGYGILYQPGQKDTAMGGGAYISRAINDILGLQWNYKTGKYGSTVTG